MKHWLEIFNNGVAPTGDVPQFDFSSFRQGLLEGCREGGRIASLFAVSGNHGLRIFGVLAFDSKGWFKIGCSEVSGRYPSLTPDCPQAHLFEREIAEQWGVIPEGHPWLKPVRLHRPSPGVFPAESGTGAETRSCAADFFQMEGEGIHEVAVGPVHAGVIEPGHFRFQCHGEKVCHLEISLGYQYRGIERALRNGPDKRTLHYMETLAGDSTVGNMTAFTGIMEALAGKEAPARAQVFRALALELERLANHTGDLGALASDVGFLPTASYCGRLRGDFLNMTALWCGSRFGRGWLCPGGVNFDADETRMDQFKRFLESVYRDVESAVRLLWESSSVLARFEETGLLQAELCQTLGVVGPAARAAGLQRDVRADLPFGFFRFSQIPVSLGSRGDVFSRAYVRWLEIQRSVEFIQSQLASLPEGKIKIGLGPLLPAAVAVSAAEGWRGEICHVAMTDEEGRFLHYKVTDPSFHNWTGLAMAMRDEDISDFPLCNKSFNLSYCGHDL